MCWDWEGNSAEVCYGHRDLLGRLSLASMRLGLRYAQACCTLRWSLLWTPSSVHIDCGRITVLRGAAGPRARLLGELSGIEWRSLAWRNVNSGILKCAFGCWGRPLIEP